METLVAIRDDRMRPLLITRTWHNIQLPKLELSGDIGDSGSNAGSDETASKPAPWHLFQLGLSWSQ
jgi:hypothetical protein